MKPELYDRIGGGLLLLIMLALAVVASEAKPELLEPAPVADALVLDADFRIAINKIEVLSPVFETALPIEIEFHIDESRAPRLHDGD